MDSTPDPSLSIKASASKLPIKRKTPDFSSSFSFAPNPGHPPTLVPNPKLRPSTPEDGAGSYDDDDAGGDRNPPPFKFHRIWTEPDEIRFLQGLLDCSADGLTFPRDLNVFYARFSDTMSQPYTKSQLSEKLRRLRKKFRVISARLARGLAKALLAPHDRALFHLSEQLWHPEFSSTSPFGAGNRQNNSNLVGVRVRFSSTLPSAPIPVPVLPTNHELNDQSVLNRIGDDHEKQEDDHVAVGGFDIEGEVKLSEVNIEFDGGMGEQEFRMPTVSEGTTSGCDSGGGLGKIAAKTVLNVFDRSLKDVRMALARQGLLCADHESIRIDSCSSKEEKVVDFEKRWRQQRVAELDVFARRLRLVLEHSIQRQ